MVGEAGSVPLEPDDAHILSLESAVIMGHTLKLNVLEPAATPLDLDALRAAVLARLSAETRATQRVDTSATEPRWVEALDFDIRDHVRRQPSGDDLTRAGLWQAVSGLMAEHLDRAKPLWTFDVIGPLADGREAIAVRIHHAMADGIAAIGFLDAVLWDVRAATAVAPPRRVPPATSSRIGEARRMPSAVVRELGHLAGPSPLDRPVTGSRELAFTVAPLAEVKAIGASRPARATVNDVLLAIVGGGLHEWLGLGDAGRRRHGDVRAQIPVSLHHRDAEAQGPGNHDSFMNVDLHHRERDPLRRLDRIRADTSRCKDLDDADELYDFLHALGRVKYVGPAALRLANSPREFAVAISNVPGPSTPVSVAGRRVTQLFSSSEPAPHHALRISAISCAEEIGIGLCTDPLAFPDIARLADSIEASYLELRGAALGVRGD
ncbi:putative diacyglycerol O-acyltransferase [Mycobacterium antarcticum]|uniref:wax ester/triacylglycerol synthase domain-containing protein n=1 Tax=Mycolicibacterium sp. TUM20985 TaxID=3023370 RepID=UPI0025729B0F|nr:wax ester/triacylglycerol synthase domain-containing protein [Mycolicibacterium sp. TUM20985]BDX34924.1 putative diacyglycerol O-acyltransferase [Mycolicibacterium sp. TUM20985]